MSKFTHGSKNNKMFNFYWYFSANPIPRELAGDFVSLPSASELTDRNMQPVRFGIGYWESFIKDVDNNKVFNL